MSNRSTNILWKYILSLGIIFGILLIFRVYFDFQHHQKMLDLDTKNLIEDIERQFKLSEENLANKYKSISKQYMNSDTVSEYFKNSKRQDLFKRIEGDYLSLKTFDPNLYVMHFIDKNNITVLRVHKPHSFGDDLSKKRPIVSYVNNSQKTQNAFEVGKNGIVYRITNAYINNDQHLGVLEFGIRPQYFVDSINKLFNINSFVLVKTKELSTLLTKKEYKTIDEYSIVSNDNLLNKIYDQIDLSKSSQIIESNEKTYMIVNSLNLYNYQHENIAKVVVIKDISDFVQENDFSLILLNILTLLVFIFILFILFIILGKFSDDIKDQTRKIDTLNRRSNHFKKKANMDQLTQIYNKSYFDKYLKKLFKTDKSGIVIFFDIDHFKKINDTHGHLAGDEILKELALIIKSDLREDDIFVRWGGEEFIIFLEEIPLDLAMHKAKEIKDLVQNNTFYNNIPVTISIGISKREDKDDKESFLKRADDLLYKAKENGRNCIMC